MSELQLILDEHGLLPKRDYKVHSISHTGDIGKELQSWIDSVEKIQKNKFAPSVIYSNKMPEIDTLMQAWDPEFEKILEENPLPDTEMDIPIEHLAKYSLALLDIPHYEANKEKGLIESMHVMMDLYTALVQHSQGQQGGAAINAQ